MRWIVLVVSCVLVDTSAVFAENAAPRPILILDQSTANAPWSVALQSTLQATLRAQKDMPIAVYIENLDFGLFGSPVYDEQLSAFLGSKYHDVRPEVIVVLGPKTLNFVMKFQQQLWPDVPVVFAAVDEKNAEQVRDRTGVTGTVMRFPIEDLVDAARIAVPDFKSLVFVGDPFSRQPYRAHFVQELEELKKQMTIIDLTGMPMAELRERIAHLEEDAVIAYTNIYGDGKGLVYTPAEALSILTGIANRPIVVDVETFVGTGSVGGFVARPAPIGEATAKLVLRILAGELPASIPVTIGDFKKPVFDWRQLQRWHIDEGRLPAGSELRFRTPTAWEQYRTQILLITAALLMQTALIIGLMYERRKRRLAELEARRRISELAHANRIAAAGVLSASIAHEINQPLAAIVSNGDAGLLWLRRSTPNVAEALSAFQQIVNEGHRLSDIITSIRALFKRDDPKTEPLDINHLVREVLTLFDAQMMHNNISLRMDLAGDLPSIGGERTQLQHVVSNLLVNATEALAGATGIRTIRISTQLQDRSVVLSVEDSGVGVDPVAQPRIFDAFFSTKPRGMGIGLAICKSIADSHGGSLGVTSSSLGGAAFLLFLPVGR